MCKEFSYDLVWVYSNIMTRRTEEKEKRLKKVKRIIDDDEHAEVESKREEKE